MQINICSIYQAKYKAYYDKTHKAKKFEIGEQVLVYRPENKVGMTRKFLPRWKGPFVVVKQLSHVNYRLESLDKTKTFNSHVQNMRHYRPWNRY
jgi:hypothetical protein